MGGKEGPLRRGKRNHNKHQTYVFPAQRENNIEQKKETMCLRRKTVSFRGVVHNVPLVPSLALFLSAPTLTLPSSLPHNMVSQRVTHPPPQDLSVSPDVSLICLNCDAVVIPFDDATQHSSTLLKDGIFPRRLAPCIR